MINYKENGLKASDYEYSGDREALNVLKKIPVLDQLLSGYMDFTIKSGMFVQVQQDCFRVTAETYPKVYGLYQTCLDRLNMSKEPELYIKREYEYNAYASGVNSPFIVVHSSMVQDCTDEELMALMGHELGHINSGHVLYHNLASYIMSLLTSNLKSLAPLVSAGALFALFDWQRKSEYTADRAGMIASGGLQPSVDLMLRLMGKGQVKQYIDFSLDTVMEQYQDFDMSKDSIIGKLLYISQTATSSHPWSIQCIKALTEWEKTECYEGITKEIQKCELTRV